MRVLEAAVAYAGAGLPVFPTHSIDADGACTCGRECTSPGKHPVTRNGVKDATTHIDVISGWWEKYPDANVALATGGNVYVVDLDGEEGLEAWAQLCAAHHTHPLHTRAATTGGGGRHLFYLPPVPGLRNTHWKIAEHIDTRGAGGYVLLAPSKHVSGNRYEWIEGAGTAPMPGWLVELVTPKMATPAQPPRIQFGETTKYGWGILTGAERRIAAAGNGNRNSTLNEEAFMVGQWIGGGEIDPRGVFERLCAASTDDDRKKVEATTRRALHDGTQFPRTKESS
jgi:hypothetical protein